MANYASIVRETNPRASSGGYKNVFLFAPRASFLSIAKPIADPVALGDTVAITTAHSFTDPAGFISWDCQTNSVTITGETVGDDGAQEIEYTAKFVVLGDSSTTQEQMNKLLNDDIIALFKEAACLDSDMYVQIGDECLSPIFKVSFDGKTTKEGKKMYTVTMASKAKYFYSGAVVFQEEV